MTNLASAPASGRPGVLLTGATGFLGGYLLKELVERTEMPIYCLTRSDGTFGARAAHGQPAFPVWCGRRGSVAA